jgi:hypothetical protein
MTFDQPKPKDNKQNEGINCFGRGCYNIASHLVMIALIHKNAWLCTSCKEDLEKDSLIE